MSGRREARLNEQFKREISEVLRREVRDPRIGTPTVTGAEVSPDLWSAKIYVRPGPGADEGEEARRDLLEGLRAATPFIRREVARNLTLRRVPEIRFEFDRTLDRAMRIEAILREVLPEDENEESPASPPSEEGSEA